MFEVLNVRRPNEGEKKQRKEEEEKEEVVVSVVVVVVVVVVVIVESAAAVVAAAAAAAVVVVVVVVVVVEIALGEILLEKLEYLILCPPSSTSVASRLLRHFQDWCSNTGNGVVFFISRI
ncbi:hypothetical protein ElyMa_003826200 [Elysia marginata]|uniref:Uncharacterized protein n=1 Tax=Elysia marginata TaxID=1093978 RepID=A0AAV4FG47_9GAST|nr:hypothetical protein ElyMa_003826200 [Elysia marginata]